MAEQRICFQFIDGLTGSLVRVWETPEQAAKRAFGEPFASYDAYVEVFPPDEARELLQTDLADVERRIGG